VDTNPGTWPFGEFSKRLLKIKDKFSNELVPFKLNIVQERVDRAVEKQLDAGKPVRIIVLKARQQGISTWSLGRMYYTATTSRNTDAMMVCHDDPSSVKLFNRLRLMYDMAPIKPMTKYSTRRELDFRNPNQRDMATNPGLLSNCTVATAGRANVGRSETLRYLHLSEVAFWENPENTLLGLEQALPRAPGTVEIIESTANGVGNEFHKRWERAIDPRKAGDWVPIFIPWHEFPEYRISVKENDWHPVPSSAEDLDAWEKEEKDLKQTYGVDDDQLNWRRYMIVNYCGNKIEMFHQEYPASAEEAFLTTGRPVFDQKLIQRRIEVLEKADQICRDRKKGARFQTGKIKMQVGSMEWTEHPEGDTRIYDWPNPNSEYIVSADVAEGMVKGDDGDSSAAHVIDRYSWEQVAVFEGKLSPQRFGEYLEKIGYLYNSAMISCEVNNHGHTVNNYLEQKQYPNVFYRRDFDKLGNPIHQKIGWETNRKTRPMLVDALDDSILRKILEINDIPTLKEMLRFVYNPNTGKQEGAPGCHDDLVISLGIGCAVMTWSDQPTQKSQRVMPNLTQDEHLHKTMIEKAWSAAKRRVDYGRWIN